MAHRIRWMKENRPHFDWVIETLGNLPSWLRSYIRIFFPFVHYMRFIREGEKLCASETILDDKKLTHYVTLTEEELNLLIVQEHDRKNFIEEKTTRYSLAIPSAAGLLGMTAALELSGWNGAVTAALFLIATFYLLASGLTSLRTLRVPYPYGSGTQFLIDTKNKQNGKYVMARELARQETMNVALEYLNEAAYASLRMGILYLVLGAIVIGTETMIKWMP